LQIGEAVNDAATARFEGWMAALEARQLADLTFSETARALRALSSTYVERRAKLAEGAALAGAGKRAAFALFYGPLHFLLVHHIVTRLGAPYTSMRALLDLGCGTAASGAGWAVACDRPMRVTGIDRHPWAVDEARRTFADLGLAGAFRVGDLTRHRAGQSFDAILLAYAVNELLEAAARDALLSWLLDCAGRGVRVVVVEPLAGFVAPWWGDWRRAFEAVGGRSDEWRVRLPLPPIVQKLDRAAGLDHRELKARTLTV
jgi:SAM-dependent methyltransferase